MKRPPSSSASLKRLGAKLAELQDERLLLDDSLERAREGFLGHESSHRRKGARVEAFSRWALVAALLVAALTGVAAHALWVSFARTAPHAVPAAAPSQPPLAFEVQPAKAAPGHPLQAGDWIAAPKTEALPIHFSDGTELVLAASSRARVVDVGSVGARVILERGETHARVVHGESSHWYFAAGPFEVHVTGTQFQVAWQPAEGTFTLELEEGSVVVTGCGLAHERAVRGGQSLRLVCDEEHMVATEQPVPRRTPASVPAPTTSQDVKKSVTPPKPAAPRMPEKMDNTQKDGALAPLASAPPSPAPTAPPPEWRIMFGADRFHEAYAAAHRAGWARLCEEGDVSDLAALADIARFTGHFDDAEQALMAIRRRFPTDERAAWAAFQLGRLCFDQRGLPRDAANWFTTAFRERPSGPLAREVLGRLMEARERAGEMDAAREAARRYMANYPSGPHADRALELLERR
ncbi:tetratricopeptide repeat protein [Pendulispora brunnea]|uniref:Tetratricopeptide repeat protein n=1 Tax=Pendulispora brunnea TaxID=2905690 RepID=A0ABZ2KK62_9BACT